MDGTEIRLASGACRLSLTNEPRATALACALARSFASELGFPEAELGMIELGVEEAVSNIVRHAFPAGELHSFDVFLEPTAIGLQVRIRDQGQPFDPTQVPDYDPDAAPGTQLHAGLGMHLIRRVFEEVEYRNLGHAGKELRLVRYRALAPLKERPQPPGAVPAEPEPVAEVRLFQPGDALGIARLAYDAYRYSYPYEHLYFPERLAALNASSELVSAVAVTPSGQVAGHTAIILEPGVGDRAELGVAMTRSEFRGQHVAERLSELLLAEATQRGFGMLFGTAVTTHVYSQRFARKLGFRDCALLPGYAPASLHFRGIQDSIEQRESFVLTVQYLDDAARRPRALALPAAHRELLAAIYAELGIPLAEPAAAQAAALPERAVVDARIRTSLGLALIEVARWGADGVAQIRARLAEFRRERFAVIGLQLPLAEPAAMASLAAIEALGFTVSGLWPGLAAEEDRLVLACITDPGFDFDRLCLDSEIARRIREHLVRTTAQGAS